MRSATWQRLLAVLALGAPLAASAVPTVLGPQVFTDHVGPNPYLASGWRFMLGATSVTPSGAGTAVQAEHLQGETAWNYAVPATPSPLLPDSYFAAVPYAGQLGSWELQATDATGTGVTTTHLLSDVRQLPLLQGLAASGPLLTPTLSWDRVDPALYPSLCQAPCPLGFDFFNYGVVVRTSSGALIHQSSLIPNLPGTATQWTLPAGVLSDNQTYLIGFRLNMSELEAINPDGRFVSPLENRSSAYLVYTTAVPEAGTATMLLAGLFTFAAVTGRRARRSG